MKLLFFLAALVSFTTGCSTTGSPVKTVERVDIQKFMGDWYVLAGRFTFLEKEVHNGLEKYTWNPEKERIDVDFTYNQGSLTGPKKSIPQKAWVSDDVSNSRWKVSPFWPFKFDYLIVALDENYRWTAIGVPDQKYLWIMARDWKNPNTTVEAAVKRLKETGYDTDNLIRVPQEWP